MKKYLFVILAFTCINFSCSKNDANCDNVSLESELQVMETFAQNNGINYVKHSSGILYQIVDPGYGASPTLNSFITCYYLGKRMDGLIFDQTTGSPYSEQLYRLIDGWKIILPLIKKGGTVRMILPSSFAYKCQGSGDVIPPNSPLYFEVQLVNVQ